MAGAKIIANPKLTVCESRCEMTRIIIRAFFSLGMCQIDPSGLHGGSLEVDRRVIGTRDGGFGGRRAARNVGRGLDRGPVWARWKPWFLKNFLVLGFVFVVTLALAWPLPGARSARPRLAISR